MKYLVIGDLHGRIEIVEAAMRLRDEYHLIFIGDYLDSFDRTLEEQQRTLTLVLNLVGDGYASGLMGNHELSYLNPKMRCSGYSISNQFYVDHYERNRMERLLEHYIWIGDDTLITHAGLSLDALDMHHCGTPQEYLEAGRFLDIGRIRGGAAPCGGIFWCDFRFEFSPVDGTRQIFGHTHSPGVVGRTAGENYCIDSQSKDKWPVAVIEDDFSIHIRDLKDMT